MLTETTLCCVPDGHDLAAALVTTTPWGARVRASARVEGFLEAGADLRGLGLVPGSGAWRLVLVCPARWCAEAPTPLDLKRFRSGRSSLLLSIDTLLPMSAEEALVGYLERGGSGTDSGWVVGVARPTVAPWVEALRSACGRGPDRVLSTHMAALGLGLQRHERAEVIEPAATGEPVAHTLEWGEPVALDEPVTTGGGGGAARVVLFGAEAEGASRCGAEDLAVAGALAPRVSRRWFPMDGPSPGAERRWLGPAAGVAAAAAIVAAGVPLIDARYASATEAIESRREATSDRVARVSEDRARVGVLRDRLAEVRGAASGWRPVMPVVRAAIEVLPGGSHLHRMEVGSGEVLLTGEAESTGGVIRALERSERFESVRRRSPSVPSEGGELFDLRAARTDATPAREGGAS